MKLSRDATHGVPAAFKGNAKVNRKRSLKVISGTSEHTFARFCITPCITLKFSKMEHISIIAQLLLKKPTDDQGTIYIRGYFKRRVAGSKSSGYKIKAAHWDPITQQVLTDEPNHSLMNAALGMKLQAIKAVLIKKEIMGAVLNRNQVKRAVKGFDDSRDFLAFCRERIVIDYPNKETRRTYSTECDKLENYRKDICFADIDFEFLAGYKKYMIDELKNEHNTWWKGLKFVSTFINKAIKVGGIIEESPFEQFDRGEYLQKPKTGLEMDQCQLIEPVCTDESKPVIMRQVAAYFLLMCYSGMRFADAMRFDPDTHVKNGRLVMTYQKFQTNINFQVYDRLAWVIELVRSNPLQISNKDFNIWLKVVGPMVGIEMELGSHRGRHSMGGFLADLEVPEAEAQLIMGHKDPRSTRIYYHLKNKKIDRSVQRIDSLQE